MGVERPYLLGERVFKWIEDNQAVFAAMRSREAFLEFVQRLPDEAEAYLPLAMMLMQSVPGIAKVQLVQLLLKAANDHPLRSSAGRPQTLDDSMKLDICDDVFALFRKRVQLGDAQERVAKRYGVSIRSVRRAWRERDTLKESEPKSFSHLFRAIQGLGD